MEKSIVNGLIKLCIFTLLGMPPLSYGFINSPGLTCFVNPINDSKGGSVKYKYAWDSEGNYQDVEGDSLFEFVDLTKLKVSVDDDKISIGISLSHIPKMLIFNLVNTPDNAIEYEWVVHFDVDNDGTDVNNISVSISSFKDKRNNRVETYGSIINETQQDIWLWRAEGAKTVSSKVKFSIIDKSTLILTINKREHQSLTKITSKTPVRFSALYNWAGKVCEDTYPDIVDE